jgi:fibronectin type III domain protein
LTAAAVSASQINLVWQDTSGNETEFRIEQTTGPGTFGQIATVGANTTIYPSTGVSPNTTYGYRVRACNAIGCSPYSNEATATTPGGASLTVPMAAHGRAFE